MFALAALVLAGSVQAGAQAPENPYETAVAARESGDYDTAIRLFEDLRAERPGDADLLRLLGTSYAFDRRYSEAIEVLSKARDLAPDDLDIRLALARALFWSGRSSAALAELDAVEARNPADSEAAQLRSQILAARAEGREGSARRGSVSFTQSLATVDLPAADRFWYASTIGGFVRVSRDVSLDASVAREDREVATDTVLQAGVDARLADNLRARFAVVATPNSDFREQWGLRAGFDFDLSRKVSFVVDARHSEFRNVNASSLSPGLRVAFDNRRTTVELRMLNLWDEANNHRVGVSGRVDHYAGETLIYGGAATYPDTEAGITRQLRSVFAGTVFPLNDRLSLRVAGEYENRRQSYERTALVIGLSFGF